VRRLLIAFYNIVSALIIVTHLIVNNRCDFYRATANAYARSCCRHLSVHLSNVWIVTKRNNRL